MASTTTQAASSKSASSKAASSKASTTSPKASSTSSTKKTQAASAKSKTSPKATSTSSPKETAASLKVEQNEKKTCSLKVALVCDTGRENCVYDMEVELEIQFDETEDVFAQQRSDRLTIVRRPQKVKVHNEIRRANPKP